MSLSGTTCILKFKNDPSIRGLGCCAGEQGLKRVAQRKAPLDTWTVIRKAKKKELRADTVCHSVDSALTFMGYFITHFPSLEI